MRSRNKKSNSRPQLPDLKNLVGEPAIKIESQTEEVIKKLGENATTNHLKNMIAEACVVPMESGGGRKLMVIKLKSDFLFADVKSVLEEVKECIRKHFGNEFITIIRGEDGSYKKKGYSFYAQK